MKEIGPRYSGESGFADIIKRINELNQQIRAIYAKRDTIPDRFLPQEDFDEVKRLLAKKDQQTVDLLLLKDPQVKVSVIIFPGEKLHPFSMNQVIIEAPNVDSPSGTIKSELTDLRKPDVCSDSLEAFKLLGNPKEIFDEPEDFFIRTVRELQKIRHARTVAINLGSDFVVEALDDLSSSVINQRLKEGASKLPPFDMSITKNISQQRVNGKPLDAVTIVTQRGSLYQFFATG